MQNNCLTVSLYTNRKKKVRESELMLKIMITSKSVAIFYVFVELKQKNVM